MDSMISVELRRRLSAETGLPLPSTSGLRLPDADRRARSAAGRLALTRAGARPRRRLRRTGSADEPIAMVSMACRLPGGIDTPEGYWELLAAGGDAVGGFPDALGPSWTCTTPTRRRSARATPARAGSSTTSTFDAPFFGISPREAVAMDPQQRLVLETAWEALERAGIGPRTLARQPHRRVPRARWAPTTATAGPRPGRAGRLRRHRQRQQRAVGPASRTRWVCRARRVTVDTACSSSLVALHLAAQALRQRRVRPGAGRRRDADGHAALFVEFSRLRALAADGRCKTFSADADGAGWAEGVGVLRAQAAVATRSATATGCWR